MSRLKTTLAALGAAALIGSLAACSSGGTATDPTIGSDTPIRLGVVGAADPEWQLLTETAAAEGITLEVIDFGEYTQPNPALAAGDIDINQFQHILYLAQYNVEAGEDLQPLGSTAIYPLGLYSRSYDSPEAIPDGARIGIPNDTTNQARGLLVLQSAGLVSLRDGGSPYSTPDDVDAAASRVEVVPIDADKIASSLPDLDAAILNNDFLEQAGFTADEAIAEDDPNDPAALPYVNVFATTSDNVDNATYQRIVELYQSTQVVLDAVQQGAGGSAQFLEIPAAELQQSLTDTQADYEASKG